MLFKKLVHLIILDTMASIQDLLITNYLRMAKIVSNILNVVGGLKRNNRYENIYRPLEVTGQKDFRSEKDLMKDAALRSGRDGVYDE